MKDQYNSSGNAKLINEDESFWLPIELWVEILGQNLDDLKTLVNSSHTSKLNREIVLSIIFSPTREQAEKIGYLRLYTLRLGCMIAYLKNPKVAINDELLRKLLNGKKQDQITKMLAQACLIIAKKDFSLEMLEVKKLKLMAGEKKLMFWACLAVLSQPKKMSEIKKFYRNITNILYSNTGLLEHMYDKRELYIIYKLIKTKKTISLLEKELAKHYSEFSNLKAEDICAPHICNRLHNILSILSLLAKDFDNGQAEKHKKALLTILNKMNQLFLSLEKVSEFNTNMRQLAIHARRVFDCLDKHFSPLDKSIESSFKILQYSKIVRREITPVAVVKPMTKSGIDEIVQSHIALSNKDEYLKQIPEIVRCQSDSIISYFSDKLVEHIKETLLKKEKEYQLGSLSQSSTIVSSLFESAYSILFDIAKRGLLAESAQKELLSLLKKEGTYPWDEEVRDFAAQILSYQLDSGGIVPEVSEALADWVKKMLADYSKNPFASSKTDFSLIFIIARNINLEYLKFDDVLQNIQHLRKIYDISSFFKPEQESGILSLTETEKSTLKSICSQVFANKIEESVFNNQEAICKLIYDILLFVSFVYPQIFVRKFRELTIDEANIKHLQNVFDALAKPKIPSSYHKELLTPVERLLTYKLSALIENKSTTAELQLLTKSIIDWTVQAKQAWDKYLQTHPDIELEKQERIDVMLRSIFNKLALRFAGESALDFWFELVDNKLNDLNPKRAQQVATASTLFTATSPSSATSSTPSTSAAITNAYEWRI